MGSSKKVVQRERRAFSAEFKAQAVGMVAERWAARRVADADRPRVGGPTGPVAGVGSRAARDARDRADGRDAGAGAAAPPARGGDAPPRAGLRKKVAVYFAKESR